MDSSLGTTDREYIVDKFCLQDESGAKYEKRIITPYVNGVAETPFEKWYQDGVEVAAPQGGVVHTYHADASLGFEYPDGDPAPTYTINGIRIKSPTSDIVSLNFASPIVVSNRGEIDSLLRPAIEAAFPDLMDALAANQGVVFTASSLTASVEVDGEFDNMSLTWQASSASDLASLAGFQIEMLPDEYITDQGSNFSQEEVEAVLTLCDECPCETCEKKLASLPLQVPLFERIENTSGAAKTYVLRKSFVNAGVVSRAGVLTLASADAPARAITVLAGESREVAMEATTRGKTQDILIGVPDGAIAEIHAVALTCDENASAAALEEYTP